LCFCGGYFAAANRGAWPLGILPAVLEWTTR
jgi:hypothetical protein